MFDKNIFAARIKQLRLSHNLSQPEFAIQFGVTQGTVARWESATRLPSLEIAYYLAEFFKTSLDYLVGRTDKR